MPGLAPAPGAARSGRAKPPPRPGRQVTDDDLRRVAAEAAREAAERVAREQPGRFEDAMRGVSVLLDTLLRNLLLGVRQEASRVLDAVARVARLLQHALWLTALALSAALIGVVVLAVGVVQLLNAVVGEPWGTLAAGLLFLAAGLVGALLVRGRLRAVGREAAALRR